MTIISPRYLDHLALSYALDALKLQNPKQTQIAMTRIETRMKSYEQDAPDRATAQAGPLDLGEHGICRGCGTTFCIAR